MGAGGGLTRLLRRVWPGANPLRRRTDLFEPAALLVVLVLTAVAVVAALLVSQSVLHSHLAEVRAEQASRHAVQARVLAHLKSDDPVTRPVAAGWSPSPQQERFAVVEAPVNGPLPAELPIWVDREDRPVPPPRPPAEATQAAGTAGAGVLIGSVLGLSVLYGGARWVVRRQRLAAWEAEWAQVGPKWRHYWP